MRLLTRAEWGATVATTPYLMHLPAVGVHVHHSVTIADDDHDLESTGDVIADMREIETIGKARFGRFPYSYCIHPSGVIGEGAGLTVGAHTENWNSTTFGVCFIGNHEHDELSDSAVDAFGELHRHLVANGWLQPGAWIEPHRARKATACPGARTIGRWADLIAATARPEVTVPSSDRIDVFVRGDDGAVWHKWFNLATFSWSPWESLGGQCVGAPTAAWFAGTLHVFVRGTDDAMWQRACSPASGWGDWFRHEGTLTSAPAVAVG